MNKNPFLKFTEGLNKRLFTILLILLACAGYVYPQQSRSELEVARLQIIKKIEETERRLSNAIANKESTLSRINALELQIDARNELIENLTNASALAPSDLPTDSHLIEEKDSARITKVNGAMADYRELLRIRLRDKLLNEEPSSLPQSDASVIKKRYLKTYEQAMQDEESYGTHESASGTESLSTATQLQQEIENRDALQKEMAELMAKATSMTSQENTIKKNLDLQYNEWENFNQAIEQAIVRAMNNGHNTPTPHSQVTPTHTALQISGLIEDKRGFLPWPVSNATITKRYGRQPHPSAPEITIENKGVDIATSDPNVTSIFSGRVITVSNVGSSGQTIIIRHEGNYYSVYSGITTPYVSEQQSITQGQTLGDLTSNNSGSHTLHFELYKEKQSLNPKHWLKNN